MTERALFLETEVGPVGVVLSEPEHPPRGVALLLHGGTPRSGVNGMWARLARMLADEGLSVLRLDYPGRGDSLLAKRGERAAFGAAKEALFWLRRRAESPGVAVIGVCGGARVAIRLAGEGQVDALALVRPYLRWVGPRRAVLRTLWRGSIRVRRRLSRVGRRRTRLDHALLRELQEVVRSTPTMFLVGEQDSWTRDAALIRELTGGAAIQMVPDVALNGFPTAAAQKETLARLMEWAAAHREAVQPQ